MREKLRTFIEKEKIRPARLFNPLFAFHLLYTYRYVHFFLTGVTGVALALLITWLLTEFHFGLEGYFTAYLIGLAVNLAYNFTLHTFVNFHTRHGHARRFVLFVAFSLFIASLQAGTVRLLTPMIGEQYYLVVIAAVILFYSTLSYLFFRLSLFSEN
jgi:hypothetical protein